MMHIVTEWMLSLLTWVPIVGAIVVMLLSGNDKHHNLVRSVALVIAIVTFGLSALMYHQFNLADYHMQFVQNFAWIPALHIRYALGIDGISALFIILTSFTNIIIILAAWNTIHKKVAQYMAVFLLLTGIMNGCFAATDSILFYIFWEASLIPLFLGIGIWGGPRRAHAAMKFFLYTFLGSIFLLVAFIYLYTQAHSFAIPAFQNLHLSHAAENWIFLAFFVAFAVKIPMWPLHTWLPDVHTQAPPGGSVVLAALMLKMGAYGFIRFSLPITPNVTAGLEWLLIILSLIAVVYVGFATLAQKDMKRLIAYSSISHMGLVTLGIFMVFMIVGRTGDVADAALSVQGAMFQMIAHAFSSGAMFIGVNYLYIRFGSHYIQDFKGMAHKMPIFAAFFMLFAMANVGLPGTSGFVGEFLIILAAFKASPWIAFIAATTVVIAPAYTLWMYKRVLFGEANESMAAKSHDITWNELLVFVLLAAPILIFGIYPEPILQLSHAATFHFVTHVTSLIPTGAY
jgi:NADH-quinone oxidoreductase subunit M